MRLIVVGTAAFWRVCLGILLIVVAWRAYQLPTLVRGIQDAAVSAITETRKDLSGQMTGFRFDVMKRVDTITSDSHHSLQEITKVADVRLEDLTSKVDAQLARTNRTVTTLVEPTRNVLDVASENADLLGRCAYQDRQTGDWFGNPDCFANRLIPMMKNFERMSATGERMALVIEKEAPATALAIRKGSEQLSGIAEDGHAITSALTKKQPWWKRVLNVVTDAITIAAKVI